MTRRAYLAQLLRVIRWQGAASLKIKIKRQLEDFRPKFLILWKVGKFVLQFDNFLIKFKWNDERMQSESSRRRRNDESVVSSKLIFLIFFVTSCYVLNKNIILSENLMSGRSEAIPGEEIQPGNWNWESNHRKIIENWENEKIEKNGAKLQETSIFQCLKYIFALLTQQIIKMRDPGLRKRLEWLVELIRLSSKE